MKSSIFKKTVAYIVSFVMTLSCIPNGIAMADTTVFTDFPTGWSREAVQAGVDNGLLYGRTETTIEPKGTLTRAEMATIINRAFGAKIEANISSYPDVNPTDWFYHEVAKGVNMQVFQGDDTGLMRPNDNITRQEVSAVIARALVLESDDYTSLDKYNDKGQISSWAKPYVSIMTQKGYIQGNDLGNFCPLDHITREEFAQIMHNIFKTYYSENNEYTKVGKDSAIIRTTDVTLKDMTIDGDLVLGDGVGKGKITLENVDIKGRLLCRGGEDTVTLKNTTVGEMVVVKDVNGVVNFHNYRDEKPFKDIVEITPATFLKRTTSTVGGGGGGGGGGGSSTTTNYDVEVVGAGKDGTTQVKKGANFTFPELTSDELLDYPSFAGWVVDNDGTLHAPGEKIKITKNVKVQAVFYYYTEYYYQNENLSDSYIQDNALTVKKFAKKGTEVKVSSEDISKNEKKYYKHNGSQVKGNVSDTSELKLKVYYVREKAKIEYDLDGANGTGFNSFEIAAGTNLVLPEKGDLEKYGYNFSGWLVNGVLCDAGDTYPIQSTDKVTIKAVWTEIGKQTLIVEHYLQKVGADGTSDSGYQLAKSGIYDGIYIDTEVYADGYIKSGNSSDANYDEDFKGFVFNPSMDDNLHVTVEEGKAAVIKIYYTRIEVAVILDSNGGTTVGSMYVQYGGEFELPGIGDVTKPNHTLTGWTDESGKIYFPGQTVTVNNPGSVKFTAIWAMDVIDNDYSKYAVEYYQQNISGTGYDMVYSYEVDNVKIGTQVTALYKEFEGFERKTPDADMTAEVLSDGTLIIKVYYERKTFILTFEENGGTPAIDDIRKKYGEAICLPDGNDIQKPGYILSGWMCDGIAYPAGGTVIAKENMTFTANWTKGVSSYTVEYWHQNIEDDDYSFVESYTVENVEIGIVVTAPIRSLPGFRCNAVASNTTGVVSSNALNNILKVFYDRNMITVGFNADGGKTDIVNKEGKFGSEITLPEVKDVTKTGYILSGWTDKDGVLYPAGGKFTLDEKETLTAYWTEEEAKLSSYTVKYYHQKTDSDDYEEVDSYIVENVAVGTTVAAIERTYKGFGINTLASNTTGVVSSDALNNILKVYYDRNIIKVSFNVIGGNEVSGKSGKYESQIVLPTKEQVVRNGYVLSGWTDEAGVLYPEGGKFTLREPVTLTAFWTEKAAEVSSYTVEYYQQNICDDKYTFVESYTVENVEVGTHIVAVGKSYEGFSLIYEKSKLSHDVESDVNNNTLRIYYDRNSVAMILIADGATFVNAEEKIYGRYGMKINLPSESDVIKNGYVLSGWKDEDGIIYPNNYEITVTETVIFKACWTEISTATFYYTVEYYHQNITDDGYTFVGSYVVDNMNTGTNVAAMVKGFNGFKFNAHISNITDVVPSDNSLVLKVYYDRNIIEVLFDENGGSNSIAPVSGRFESVIELPDANDVSKTGYVLYGWEDEDGVIYPAGGNYTLKETETLKAYWQEEVTAPKVSGVVIETYLLNVGATKGDIANYTLFKSVYVGDVPVGENIQIVPSGITGFEFNQTISTVSGTVTENANITLKLYYDRIVSNVIFNTNGGAPVSSTTAQYGETITLPDENSTTNPGKILAGWEFNGTTYAPGAQVTITEVSDAQFKAVWTDAPQKYANYKVEHYQLNVDGTNGVTSDYTLFETETVENVLVGAQATANEKNYRGFVTNADGINTITGTVTEDGTLVLKVYYDRKVINVTFDENGGTPDMTDGSFQYGAVVTLPGDSSFVKEGYELVGWQSTDGTIYPAGYDLTIDVESDTEFVAYWKLKEVETSSYKVEHYRIIHGGISGNLSDYELIETETFNGVEVNSQVSAVSKEYEGYEVNETISVLSGTVQPDGSLVLNVYYDVAVIDVTFDEDGGTPDLTDFSVTYGDSFRLADETEISKYGYYLYKWHGSDGVLYDPGASIMVDFVDDITFTAVWAPLGQYMYVVEIYRQSVDGTEYELYETVDGEFGYEGDIITLDVSALPEYTGFTYDNENSGNKLSGEITQKGLTLKAYYSRNQVDISFDLNGGIALDSETDSYKVYFGSEITLPLNTSVEKEYAKLVGWSYDGNEYAIGETIVIDTEPEYGYVFVATWEDLVTYEVIFYDKWFLEVGNVKVIENETVEEPEFPEDELYAAEGYRENSYISSTLYSGENEYVHEVYTDWYFEHPETGEFIRFDETVPVSADIVVDGILEVFPMSPMLDIDIDFDLKGVSESFNFSAFYEATVFDSNGNVIKGTRAMDTFKDILWANLNSESGEDSQIKVFAKEYIDQALAKLSERALIDENHNVKLFDLFIKFSQIIGEEKLEEYIIENAKKTLSQNNDLKGYIFDYFETVANSGSEDDVKELEGLLEETIKGALGGSDSDKILSIIEELCVKMLNDPKTIESAIKNVAGVEIDVTETDLTSNAKDVILSWANMLVTNDMLDSVLREIPYNKKSDGTYVYTSGNIQGVTTKDFIINIINNADFTLDDLDELGISRDELFSHIKDSLINEIIVKLDNDEDFFNKSVSYVFKGTPFEDFTKDKVKSQTVDFFKDVVHAYFNTMTVEELAIELGYDDQDAINEFFRNHKREIIKAIVYELDNDPKFFNHVISRTDFAGLITFNDVMTLDVKELIAKVAGNKIESMSGDDLVSYDVVKSVIEDFDTIVSELTGKIKTDDTFFDTVISRAFTGTLLDRYTLSSMPQSTLDFAKELVAEKMEDLTDDELGDLAGKGDASGLVDFAKEEIAKIIIDNLESDTDSIYSDMVYELTGKTSSEIDEISSKEAFIIMLKSLAEDAILSGNYDDIKKLIDPEETDWSAFDWDTFFAGFEYSLTNDDVVDGYLLNISYGRYTLDENSVDRAEYPDAESIPATSKEMFIGFVQARLAENLDETLDEYGYDYTRIIEEARKYANDAVIEKLESDSYFLKEQIESMTGVTLVSVSSDSRTLISDVIEAKLETVSDVDDSFAQILGFADLGALLEDSMVKSMIKEEVVSKINTDEAFLKDQIKEYTGISYTTIPTESHILFDDIVENKVNAVNSIDYSLADQLGYSSVEELLDAAKPGVIETVIDEIGDNVENYRKYIGGYIGTSFGEIPENSMEFIKKYARNVLEGMTEAQIREELRLMGYTNEDIDEAIEGEIKNVLGNPDDELIVTLIKMVSKKYNNITSLSEAPQIAKEFVSEEALFRLESDDDTLRKALLEMFGYVPEKLFTDSSYTTKQFLIDVVVYMFEHDETKRDSIIDQAVVELIEGGDLSALEDYVDYAVNYLDSQVNPDGTTKLDNVIDDIIEARYRDTLDKLVDQLINEETFEIEPSTSFILSAFEMQVKAYSFDELIKGVPEAVFKIYPREKLEEIYTRAYNNLLSQIEEGKLKNQNGETAVIDTGLKFEINPVGDIYVPLRNRAIEIISGVDKINNNYYYAENKYLQELIKLTDASNFVDESAQSESGYKLKEYNDYYDLILRTVIIGDDAFTWYTDKLSPEKLDELMLNYEDLAVKYANVIADMVETYATDGELPEKLDKDKVRAVESAIRNRFPGLLDKILDWYVESPVNKEYSEDDYAKVRSLVQKVFKRVNITTDELFEIPGKVIVKLVDAFKENDDKLITKLDEILDNIAKVGNNEYVGTLKGNKVTVKLDGDVYYITVKGKTLKVTLSGGNYTVDFNGKTGIFNQTENSYKFSVDENNSICVRRSIQ